MNQFLTGGNAVRIVIEGAARNASMRRRRIVSDFGCCGSKAKATASALGISLREYVTQAVEEKLSAGQRSGKPWLECAGELAHLHKETKRIQRIIDEELRGYPAGTEGCW